MKNTKNLLITGIALVTALFASVQVTAMIRAWDTPYYLLNPENTNLNETRTVNPHLRPVDQSSLWEKIRTLTDRQQRMYNPDDSRFVANTRERIRRHVQLQRSIEAAKSVYYGNRKYSRDEVNHALMQ